MKSLHSRQKQRVLIIGDANSLVIKNLVNDVYLPAGYLVSLVDASISRYSNYYKELGVANFPFLCALPKSLLSTDVNPIIRDLMALVRLRTKSAQYCFDIVFVQCLNPANMEIARSSNIQSEKYVASFWGSDLLRASGVRIKWLSQVLETFDAITIHPRATMQNAFEKRFKSLFDNKLSLVLMPGENNEIQNVLLSETQEFVKRYLNLPQDKLIIAIGYNGNPMHQHMAAIEAIACMPSKWKEKMHLVFLMTYPSGLDEYRDRVKAVATKAGFNSTFLTDFMSERDIARFRLATDVFVHAQVSDAASASVREHLKAGCIVFNPSWIDYRELRDMGAEYIQYDSFDDLAVLFARVVIGDIEVDTEKNMRLLETDAYDECVRDSWQALLARL